MTLRDIGRAARAAAVGGLATAVFAGAGWAQPKGEFVDAPHPWQINLHESVTPVMDKVIELHNLLLVIITLISLFVLGLLIYAMVRFRASRNPTPSQTTHNTTLEVAWTVIPIVILVVIAIPSFRLLYYGDKARDAQLTVKVTGQQWYWNYEYPEHKIVLDSRMLSEADRLKLKPNQPRLLAVDNEMVVPVDTVVRIIGTAAEGSMHGWTVPAFGIKKSVMVGRINEGWINVRKEGLYFGQCSQICGKDHAFMPIAVRVVSKDAFKAWVEEQKKKAEADAPRPSVETAARD